MAAGAARSPWATASLSDAAGALEATFLPDAGMLCASLRHGGEELLAQRQGVEAYARDGRTMAIPLLYPWANRLAAFDYSIGGRTVIVPHDQQLVTLDGNGLPIHGVVGGRMAWSLDESASTSRSLTARLSWSGSQAEIFDVFPFRHDLAFQARLADGCLELGVTVHACATDEVPVAFGFHPYLALPGADRERWQVELPAMRPLLLDPRQIPCGHGEPQEGRRFELAEHEFDDGFDRVGDTAGFAVAAGGLRLELELLEGYPCAQLFAPRGSQFICFEPMTAPANALGSGEGLRVLSAGERYRARFSVRVARAG